MGFYEGMAATASKLLTRFGKTITFKRTFGSSSGPVTGEEIAGVVTYYTPKGLFKQIDSKFIDGTRIKVGDKMLVVDNSFEPTTTDIVPINSVDWHIEEITPIEPADTPLVYFVRIRK